MKYLLAESNREVVRQLAWSNVLLGFDYDGTLAPIVADPDAARMRARTRELLEQIAHLYPSIVISGRGQPDIMKRVRGLGLREAIGNHGLEPWRYSGSFASEVRGWTALLAARLGPIKGIFVEDKVFSVAIHYRNCRAKRAARAAIEAAIAELGPVRVIGGKLVFNLVSRRAPHKGLALLAARDRAGCDTAFYVGDDTTDEDVFSLEEPGRLFTVRVEQSRRSQARYFIRRQAEIDALLEALIACRRRSPRPSWMDDDRGAA
jgi:trehalose 6-phosphate phosphatase